MTEDTTGGRVDKWLWHARFFKTRSKATSIVAEKGVRINSERTVKPAQTVRPGDVLTFTAGSLVRVVRIEATAQRRGPASEAQGLYTDLDPPERREPAADGPGRDAGSGRPSKRERREIDALRRSRT
ncbi:MAG: RNA-binding S4 domain-containing protein [Pseudomonadota bacterium]